MKMIILSESPSLSPHLLSILQK